MPLQMLANTSLFSPPINDNDSDPKELFANVIESNSTSFLCPISTCGRYFASKRNLVDHYRGHHQGTKPHICHYPSCGKSFLRPAHLLIHTRIHTGEKPFACRYPGCNKTWNQKSALKQHLRSHTGEKPFECIVQGCGKKFSTSSSCKRHIGTHEKYDQQDLVQQVSPLQMKQIPLQPVPSIPRSMSLQPFQHQPQQDFYSDHSSPSPSMNLMKRKSSVVEDDFWMMLPNKKVLVKPTISNLVDSDDSSSNTSSNNSCCTSSDDEQEAFAARFAPTSPTPSTVKMTVNFLVN